MLPGCSFDADGYLLRYVDLELDALWSQRLAVMIDGPKGVGKTATAQRRCDVEFQLDNRAVMERVRAGLDNQISPGQCVLFDEWQHYGPIVDYVRRCIDRKDQNVYLMTGSAFPQESTTTHSGAGRIISIRMRPLALSERQGTKPSILIQDLFEGHALVSKDKSEMQTEFTIDDYAAQICATGLPDVGELDSQRLRRAQIESYLSRIIDRDIPEAGGVLRRPHSLLAWMRAYAAASSTCATYDAILRAASAGEADKPSKATTYTYRDLLSSIWLLDPVLPWSNPHVPLRRLTGQVKHQLSDPGLAARLLGVGPEELLSGKPGVSEILGQLFESLATLTVRAAGQAAEADTYHLRTKGGTHEIDLLLERYDGKVIAFEVKLANHVEDSDVRHLQWLKGQLGERLVEMVVLNTGPVAYRRDDGVLVVPLSLLG